MQLEWLTPKTSLCQKGSLAAFTLPTISDFCGQAANGRGEPGNPGKARKWVLCHPGFDTELVNIL